MRFRKLWMPALCLVSCLVGYALAVSYPLHHERWTGTGTRHNTEEFSIQTPSAGAAAIFVPGTDNTNALGTSALRFSDVQAYDMTLTDDLVVTDDVTVSGTLNAPQAQLSVQVSTAPRTSSTQVVINSTGTLVWNSTDGGLCVSSGTTQSTLVASSAPDTACGH